jgi:hypothetical protein
MELVFKASVDEFSYMHESFFVIRLHKALSTALLGQPRNLAIAGASLLLSSLTAFSGALAFCVDEACLLKIGETIQNAVKCGLNYY